MDIYDFIIKKRCNTYIRFDTDMSIKVCDIDLKANCYTFCVVWLIYVSLVCFLCQTEIIGVTSTCKYCLLDPKNCFCTILLLRSMSYRLTVHLAHYFLPF